MLRSAAEQQFWAENIAAIRLSSLHLADKSHSHVSVHMSLGLQAFVSPNLTASGGQGHYEMPIFSSFTFWRGSLVFFFCIFACSPRCPLQYACCCCLGRTGALSSNYRCATGRPSSVSTHNLPRVGGGEWQHVDRLKNILRGVFWCRSRVSGPRKPGQ